MRQPVTDPAAIAAAIARIRSLALARIFHTIRCIGAPNQRKLLWPNNLRLITEHPDGDRV